MNILETIIERKKQEVAFAKSQKSIVELKNSEFYDRKSYSLKEILKTKSGIIAEFKRKSPSKG
ncbi:MAG: indole-3-glycerol-phosphate synthase TrpC, partial [Chryseobacterium sp.]|nr:indole-3-glycerol-phosphate synthase TrpC [Candidatus Chryseobacterium enterohippi]